LLRQKSTNERRPENPACVWQGCTSRFPEGASIELCATVMNSSGSLMRCTIGDSLHVRSSMTFFALIKKGTNETRPENEYGPFSGRSID